MIQPITASHERGIRKVKLEKELEKADMSDQDREQMRQRYSLSLYSPFQMKMKERE